MTMSFFNPYCSETFHWLSLKIHLLFSFFGWLEGQSLLYCLIPSRAREGGEFLSVSQFFSSKHQQKMYFIQYICPHGGAVVYRWQIKALFVPLLHLLYIEMHLVHPRNISHLPSNWKINHKTDFKLCHVLFRWRYLQYVGLQWCNYSFWCCFFLGREGGCGCFWLQILKHLVLKVHRVFPPHPPSHVSVSARALARARCLCVFYLNVTIRFRRAACHFLRYVACHVNLTISWHCGTFSIYVHLLYVRPAFHWAPRCIGMGWIVAVFS